MLSPAPGLLRRLLRFANRRRMRNTEIGQIIACALLGAAVGLLVAITEVGLSRGLTSVSRVSR